jgi:phospholipid/cholesterol/gamma-HCH transport system substrate-binding protein
MMALTQPRKRLLLLIVFGVACLGVIGALLDLTGMHVNKPYEVTVTAPDVDNLVTHGRVETAGIVVGAVETTEVTPAGAQGVISLFPQYAPLHQGAHVRIGDRSLVEETYLDLTDGTGPALPSGSALPPSAVRTSTELGDVLHSLDQPTRAALTQLVRSGGAATLGTTEQVGQVFAGLGQLGRQGSTAIDAIAAQSDDLRTLTRDTTVILNALDTGQGQIVSLVDNADRVTAASASQRGAIEATMRRLPGVLDSAHTAADKLTDLAGALYPVAASLHTAGPQLNDAVDHLPEVSAKLRRLLPTLNDTLDKAPHTLDRVPTFGDDMRAHLIPRGRDILQDLNPMVGYLRPYGPDLAGFFANFNAILNYTDDSGNHYWRTFLPLNDASVDTPLGLKVGALTYYNPIPKAGAGSNPGPFTGKFPRLQRQPR